MASGSGLGDGVAGGLGEVFTCPAGVWLTTLWGAAHAVVTTRTTTATATQPLVTGFAGRSL
jgi:hypothetical protein